MNWGSRFLLASAAGFLVLLSPAKSPASYSSDLLRYYKVDDSLGAAEIIDATGNYNGPIGDSDVTLEVSGVYGTAIQFVGNSDGTRDTIGTNVFDAGYPHSNAEDNFAFGAWIRTNDSHHIDVEGSGFDNHAEGQVWAFGGAWSYAVDNIGSAKLSVGTNGVSVFETAASYLHPRLVHEQSLGTDWHHIVVVYENKRPTLYIDGEFKRTGLTSARSHVVMPSEIGGTTWRDLDGAMDEIFVTSRSLSAEEVQEIYASGVEAVFSTDTDHDGIPDDIDRCPSAPLESLAEGSWEQLSNMPTARCLSTAVGLDGDVYVIGGRGSHNWSDEPTGSRVERYHSASDTWEAVTSIPTPRNQAVSVVVNGRIYVIGGWHNGSDTSQVEIYDPDTNSWSVGSPLPEAVADMAGSLINGKIYVFGGWRTTGQNQGSQSSSVYAYDPGADSWSSVTSMPTPKNNPGSAVVDGQAYVMGGRYWTGVGATDAVERYSSATDSWAAMASLPAQTGLGESVAAYGGRIASVGGSEIWSYDPQDDAWSILTAPEGGQGGHHVVIDGAIYLVSGGCGGDEGQATLFAYHPNHADSDGDGTGDVCEGSAALSSAVSINFRGDGPVVSPSDTAGVVPLQNWNNMPPAEPQDGGTAEMNPGTDWSGTIVDELGEATDLSITWHVPNRWQTFRDDDNGDARMMWGILWSHQTTGLDESDLWIEIGGLPSDPEALFDLYVYLGEHPIVSGNPQWSGSGHLGKVSVREDSRYFLGNPGTVPIAWQCCNPFDGYVEGTATEVGSATLSNYMVFEDLSGPTVRVSVASDHYYLGAHGIQIVPAPEPGSAVVGLIALMSLAVVRRAVPRR